MKFTTKSAASDKIILANDHYVGMAYDCSSLTADEDGVIKAGTIVPANDATAIGVLLTDVVKADNPNGMLVIHGFITESKLPAEPAATAKTALKMITFV